jgi:hypothetical protein
MREYPQYTGPLRSHAKPAIAFLGVAAALFAGYWWYLQGLEERCREQCLANGHKQYKYVEPTGSGKRIRPGTCSCNG